MKKPAQGSQSDDAAVFREAMRGVVPLEAPPRVERRPQRPASIPLKRPLEESPDSPAHPDCAVALGDELVYARPGIARSVLRILRRGHWAVHEDLDLHGLTAPQARSATETFLCDCVQRGVRCVRIVHGKGLRSRNRVPVLKRKLGTWLMRRDDVLAFCEAKPADGGSGAVVVLLRG